MPGDILLQKNKIRNSLLGDLQIVTEGGICYEENQQSFNYHQRNHATYLHYCSYQHLEQDS